MRKHTGTHASVARPLGIVIAAAALGCAPAESGQRGEQVGEAVEQLQIDGLNQNVSYSASVNSSTTSVAVPVGGGGRITVGFTHQSAASHRNGWSSYNPSTGVWDSHTASQPGYTWPAPAGTPAGGGSFDKYEGSPVLLSTSVSNEIFYVSQGSTTTATNEVIIARSADGGQHFSNPTYVATASAPAGGYLRDAYATAYAPDNGVWIVYERDFGWGTNYFLRRVHWSSSSAQFVFDTDPIAFSRSETYGVSIAAQHDADGREHVYLAHASGPGVQKACCNGTAQVDWVISSGQWSPADPNVIPSWTEFPMATDVAWPSCVGADGFCNPGGTYARPEPDVVIDGTTCWFAFSMSDLPTSLFSRVWVYKTDDMINWSKQGFRGVNGRDQWSPVLGRKGHSLGVAYKTSEGSSDNYHMKLRGAVTLDDGTTWGVPGDVTDGGMGVPWFVYLNSGRWDGIAGVADGQFVTTWADQRSGGNLAAYVEKFW